MYLLKINTTIIDRNLCCCGGRLGEYIPVSALEGITLGCGAPGPILPSGAIPGSCLQEGTKMYMYFQSCYFFKYSGATYAKPKTMCQVTPSVISWSIWILLSLAHLDIAHRSWRPSVILFTHSTVGALSWSHELLTSCRKYSTHTEGPFFGLSWRII